MAHMARIEASVFEATLAAWLDTEDLAVRASAAKTTQLLAAAAEGSTTGQIYAQHGGRVLDGLPCLTVNAKEGMALFRASQDAAQLISSVTKEGETSIITITSAVPVRFTFSIPSAALEPLAGMR